MSRNSCYISMHYDAIRNCYAEWNCSSIVSFRLLSADEGVVPRNPHHFTSRDATMMRATPRKTSMVDRVTVARRSEIMSSIRSKDTGPEMKIRRMVHGMGYRYRLHGSDLPGKPDLVFPSRRKGIFVHGCFWHAHACKYGRRTPKSNVTFWNEKLLRNKERDRRVLSALRRRGWKVLVVWQCQCNNIEKVRKRIIAFLEVGE